MDRLQIGLSLGGGRNGIAGFDPKNGVPGQGNLILSLTAPTGVIAVAPTLWTPARVDLLLSATAPTIDQTLTVWSATSSTVDNATYTFTSVDIGAASASRRVIVGAVQRLTPSVTATSVAIGGVSASLLKRQVSGNGNAEFWMATVPTGTTANVVVTWSATVGSCGVSVWAVPNLNSDTPIDTDGGNISNSPNGSNVTITTQSGAYVFGVAMHANTGGSGNLIWRNMNELYDQVLEAQANTSHFGAAQVIATGISMSVGVDIDQGNADSNSPFAVVVLK